MTDDRLPLADLLAKAGEGDFLRSVAKTVLQMLTEADVEARLAASCRSVLIRSPGLRGNSEGATTTHSCPATLSCH